MPGEGIPIIFQFCGVLVYILLVHLGPPDAGNAGPELNHSSAFVPIHPIPLNRPPLT